MAFSGLAGTDAYFKGNMQSNLGFNQMGLQDQTMKLREEENKRANLQSGLQVEQGAREAEKFTRDKLQWPTEDEVNSLKLQTIRTEAFHGAMKDFILGNDPSAFDRMKQANPNLQDIRQNQQGGLDFIGKDGKVTSTDKNQLLQAAYREPLIDGVPISQAVKLLDMTTARLKQQVEQGKIDNLPLEKAKLRAEINKLNRPDKPEKPTNMPPWYDALGMATIGPEYNTAAGQNKFAAWYQQQMATPEGQKKIFEFSSQVAANTSTPFYNVIQTSEGLVPFNARTGTPEQPSGYGKPLPGEMITAQQQIGTITDALERVRKNYDPSYIGPLAGRAGRVKESTVGVDEKQGSFYADLESIKNALIYLQSGKQINEQEYKRLLGQLPDRNLPVSTFNARMNTFGRMFDSIIANRQKNMGGYGSQKTPDARATEPTSSVPGNLRQLDAGAGAERQVVKTGTDPQTGRKVIVYSDGSAEYAQ